MVADTAAERRGKDDMTIINELKAAIKQWEGFAGELHDTENMRNYVDSWKFTWRMRRAAGEITEFEYSDGLTALEAVEKIVDRLEAAAEQQRDSKG